MQDFISKLKVETARGYMPEFSFYRPIAQLEALQRVLPNLDIEMALGLLHKIISWPHPTPEGWLAVVKENFLAKTPDQALWEILERLNSLYIDQHDGKLVNLIKSEIEKGYLITEPKTSLLTNKLCFRQQVLLPEAQVYWLPCQSGIAHRGEAVEYAHFFAVANEFLLTTYQCVNLLLAMPQRLPILSVQNEHLLQIVCGGDRVWGGETFSRAPCLFTWHSPRVINLDNFFIGAASVCYGSPSGYLPSFEP